MAVIAANAVVARKLLVVLVVALANFKVARLVNAKEESMMVSNRETKQVVLQGIKYWAYTPPKMGDILKPVSFDAAEDLIINDQDTYDHVTRQVHGIEIDDSDQDKLDADGWHKKAGELLNEVNVLKQQKKELETAITNLRVPENYKPDVHFHLTKNHIVEHTQVGNTTVTKIMPRDLCSTKGEILT